jgi:hypothetical protein
LPLPGAPRLTNLQVPRRCTSPGFFLCRLFSLACCYSATNTNDQSSYDRRSSLILPQNNLAPFDRGLLFDWAVLKSRVARFGENQSKRTCTGCRTCWEIGEAVMDEKVRSVRQGCARQGRAGWRGGGADPRAAAGSSVVGAAGRSQSHGRKVPGSTLKAAAISSSASS